MDPWCLHRPPPPAAKSYAAPCALTAYPSSLQTYTGAPVPPLPPHCSQALNSGPRIVIDLAFEDKMVENDIRHLCKQLGFSYSANKTAEKPAHMVLTSFTGNVASTAKKMISGRGGLGPGFKCVRTLPALRVSSTQESTV